MIRKSKSYVRPKKAYEKSRILEENNLIEKYGLKNKREIWKTQAKISYFRRRAKSLANASTEEQSILFNKLSEKGIAVSSISDVLALNIENLLNRRLPTIVFKKKMANTPRQARQMVTHKRILINDKFVNSPSYIVSVAEEDKISIKQSAKKEINEVVANA